MSKILKRPDYINYYTRFIRRGEYSQDDIDQLEAEPALAQWDVPRAFFWSTSAWVHHTLILFIPVTLTIMSYLAMGFTYMPIGMTVLFSFVFGSLYYIGRSQYHHIGYKISKSGILTDNLKVYPRFRYGNQDPTKFLQKLRIVAVILILLALIINPFYLVGAGSALFLSYMKPRIDDGEKALYVPGFWYSDKANYVKVNIVPKRRLVVCLVSEDYTTGRHLFCTADNFEQVIKLVRQYLPDAKYVENERVF
jgi:hypothetical protein